MKDSAHLLSLLKFIVRDIAKVRFTAVCVMNIFPYQSLLYHHHYIYIMSEFGLGGGVQGWRGLEVKVDFSRVTLTGLTYFVEPEIWIVSPILIISNPQSYSAMKGTFAIILIIFMSLAGYFLYGPYNTYKDLMTNPERQAGSGCSLICHYLVLESLLS